MKRSNLQILNLLLSVIVMCPSLTLSLLSVTFAFVSWMLNHSLNCRLHQSCLALNHSESWNTNLINCLFSKDRTNHSSQMCPNQMTYNKWDTSKTSALNEKESLLCLDKCCSGLLKSNIFIWFAPKWLPQNKWHFFPQISRHVSIISVLNWESKIRQIHWVEFREVSIIQPKWNESIWNHLIDNSDYQWSYQRHRKGEITKRTITKNFTNAKSTNSNIEIDRQPPSFGREWLRVLLELQQDWRESRIG